MPKPHAHRLAAFSLAFLWGWTALVSLLAPATGLQLLGELGLPEAARWPALLAGSGIDAAFGVLTLSRPSRRLWLVQMVVIVGYTAIITLWLPHLWLHPFGPISKNLPILALLWLCAQPEEN